MTSDQLPPWEYNALPFYLDAVHLEAARRVALTSIREEVKGVRLDPVLGEAAYFRLSGTDYKHNRQRIESLLAGQPDVTDARGRPFYSAVLVPDPSMANGGLHPIGVVARTGYLGSVWNENGLVGSSRVASAVDRRRFFATRLYIERRDSGFEIKVWVWAQPLQHHHS